MLSTWKGRGWYWVWDECEDEAILTYLTSYVDEWYPYVYRAASLDEWGTGFRNCKPVTDIEFNELVLAQYPGQMPLDLINQS